MCSHSGQGLCRRPPGSEDCRSECIIILNYLDRCRNCKTADIMFVIEYAKARQSEQNANLRYGVTYFSSLSFTAFCRLGYIISRDRMIRITRDILMETWPRISWFKFKSGSSRTQSSEHYIETLNKSYVTRSDRARAIVRRWKVWEYYTDVVVNCNRIFGSHSGPKYVMA